MFPRQRLFETSRKWFKFSVSCIQRVNKEGFSSWRRTSNHRHSAELQCGDDCSPLHHHVTYKQITFRKEELINSTKNEKFELFQCCFSFIYHPVAYLIPTIQNKRFFQSEIFTGINTTGLITLSSPSQQSYDVKFIAASKPQQQQQPYPPYTPDQYQPTPTTGYQ